jgi:cysteinylglycine-S-conjugate dipeptidase
MNSSNASANSHAPPTPETVRALMPALRDDLARLVAIPSISVLGYPADTRADLLEAYGEVVRLFSDAGVTMLEPLELPDTAPVVMGEIPASDGAPTVLLYSHYDVVPVGDESKWESPPFEATERDGAVYGRGAADTKSNILMHVGAIRAWKGRPPVGIKVVIEGQEEVGGGAFGTFPASRPDLFAVDAIVIGDMGSVRPGVPTLTTALRGMMAVTVEARTLAGLKHSGQFGGAAPSSPRSRFPSRDCREHRSSSHARAGADLRHHRRHGRDRFVARPEARGRRRLCRRRGAGRRARGRARA